MQAVKYKLMEMITALVPSVGIRWHIIDESSEEVSCVVFAQIKTGSLFMDLEVNEQTLHESDYRRP